MSTYHGTREAITPATANDNWALDAASGEQAYVTEVSISGSGTTSAAARTRWTRSSSGATPVSGDVQKHRANSPTNLVNFVSSWTTQPTLTAGSLLTLGWNFHAGVVIWKATPGEDEWELIGAGHISCRNGAGTTESSYGVRWREA